MREPNFESQCLGPEPEFRTNECPFWAVSCPGSPLFLLQGDQLSSPPSLCEWNPEPSEATPCSGPPEIICVPAIPPLKTLRKLLGDQGNDTRVTGDTHTWRKHNLDLAAPRYRCPGLQTALPTGKCLCSGRMEPGWHWRRSLNVNVVQEIKHQEKFQPKTLCPEHSD